MSILSGKPFGAPSDSSSHSQRDGERSRDDDEAGRSPYAPKRVRGGFIAEPVRRIEEPIRRVEEPVRRADDDAAAPPRFLLSSRDAPGKERGLTDFPKSSLQFEDELNAAGIGRTQQVADTERRRAPRESGQAPQARPSDGARHAPETHARERAAPPPQPTIDDDELKRLEESVRLLQREVSSGRGRAPDGPPAAPAVKPDDAAQRRRAGATINGVPVPRSLQPEILRRPPQEGANRGRLQTALAIVVAGVVAAPIAYYFSSGSSDRPTPEAVVAAAEPRAVEPSRAVEPISVRTQRVDPAAAQSSSPWPKGATTNSDPWQNVPAPRLAVPQEPAPQQRAPAPQAAPPQQPAPPPQAAAPQAPPPAAQSAAPQPPAPPVTVVPKQAAAPPASEAAETPRASEQARPAVPTRTLGQAEIDLLVKQGQQFVAAGDFVTARLVFQRAAEAGNAVAALALGASYDPGVLSSLGVRGIEADVSKARAWYQKAKEFGDPEATRRLDVLANRGGR